MLTAAALLVLATLAGAFGWLFGGPKRIAKKLLDLNDLVYGRSERLQLTRPEHFSHLDRSRYDAMELELEEFGAVTLGDFEPLTLNRLNASAPTFVRAMRTKDERTAIGFYAILPRPGFRWLSSSAAPAEFLECVTEIGEGEFLLTATGDAAAISEVPGVKAELVPSTLSWPRVLARHHQRVVQALDEGREIAPVRSATDYVEVQYRLMETRRPHLHGVEAVLEMIDREWPRRADNILLKQAVRAEAARRRQIPQGAPRTDPG